MPQCNTNLRGLPILRYRSACLHQFSLWGIVSFRQNRTTTKNRTTTRTQIVNELITFCFVGCWRVGVKLKAGAFFKKGCVFNLKLFPLPPWNAPAYPVWNSCQKRWNAPQPASTASLYALVRAKDEQNWTSHFRKFNEGKTRPGKEIWIPLDCQQEQQEDGELHHLRRDQGRVASAYLQQQSLCQRQKKSLGGSVLQMSKVQVLSRTRSSPRWPGNSYITHTHTTVVVRYNFFDLF